MPRMSFDQEELQSEIVTSSETPAESLYAHYPGHQAAPWFARMCLSTGRLSCVRKA